MTQPLANHQTSLNPGGSSEVGVTWVCQYLAQWGNYIEILAISTR